MALGTANIPELLNDQVASLLVQPLEAASVVLSSGVRVFDTAGVLRIPKLTGSSAVGYYSEHEEIASTHSTTFDEVVLMPTDRASIKTIERYSRESVRQSVIGLDAVLKARLTKVVADKLDTELLKGTGADDGITGILNQPGVETGVFDPTDPDTILDAIATLNANEVEPNRIFMSGAAFSQMRKIKQDSGSARYLLEPDPTRESSQRLFNVPLVVTNKLGQFDVIVADTTNIAVARDVNPSITVLTERYAEFDEIGLRITCRYDLGLLHPEAVCVLSEPGS